MDARAATLRDVYDRTYYAALAGICASPDTTLPEVEAATRIALESVRTHAARMAELERVIAEGAE